MGRVTTAVRQWHVPMQIWWEWMKILFFAAGEGFGAGMGGMQCTCGAVSGACMVAGLFKDRNTKKNRSQKVRHIVSAERSFRNLERRTVPWSARI